MSAHSGLSQYRLLGHTGLRVSPLALGAMTFGTDRVDDTTARAIFDRYLAAGGNVVDTADIYTGGRSEELLGAFIAASGTRDRLVLSTKFGMATTPGDPNSGGNGRKNILASLEASLRRLRTDYVDLYWLHLWDALTPVDEVLATFDALVRSGKVRAVGLSNVPAWYVAKAQLLAQARGWEPIAALQLEYSLAERAIEREHIPAALDLGIGVVPWSPLANGLLTGKYAAPAAEGDRPAGHGRLADLAADGILERTRRSGNPTFSKLFTDRTWRIVQTLSQVAQQIGRTPAQVALNWVTRQPAVATTLVGATTVRQLEDNLAALDVDLPPALAEQLDQVSRPEPGYPYYFFSAAARSMVSAGTAVSPAPSGPHRT